MRTLTTLLLTAVCAVSLPMTTLEAVGVPHPPPADVRAVLREVQRAQNEYRAAHGRYTGSLSALGLRRPADVDVRVSAQGAGGWSAVATAAEEECAVFHGTAPAPRSYARTAGRIACRGR